MNYFLTVIKKYAVFNGRSRRAEYWYFFLFNIIIGVVLGIIRAVAGDSGSIFAYISYIYSLALLIPGLAVSVRRLHDIGKSGWWLFISLVPLVGTIWLIVLLATDSNPGENKFGPNPKGAPTS